MDGPIEVGRTTYQQHNNSCAELNPAYMLLLLMMGHFSTGFEDDSRSSVVIFYHNTNKAPS